MSPRHLRRRGLAVAVTTATLVGTAATSAVAGPAPVQAGGGGGAPRPDFTLTLLHANDQESALLPITTEDGQVFAGAARFTQLLQREERTADRRAPGPGEAAEQGVLTVSGGDHFLPGPNLAASDESGRRNYDAVAFSLADWDVAILGNHDFDRGPDYLGRWFDDVTSDTPFVARNLGFQREPELLAEVRDGTIVTASVQRVEGERIGIIGLTTPDLPELTSSEDVTVNPDLARLANAQAAAYQRNGVDKVVLVSHLQNIQNEVALAGDLRGVDLIVGAGGGETLAGPGDRVLPDSEVAGTYPLLARDADGDVVPVVTTAGLYRYVGRLVVTFDQRGELLRVHDSLSKPVLVAASGFNSVKPNQVVRRQVEQPVAAYVDSLARTIVGRSEVPLDGRRSSVRTAETNLGDLVADSLLDAGQDGAAAAGVTPPVVALQNSGGIRNDSIIPAGNLTELDTYSVLPFSNFTSVAPAMPIATFVAGVENGLDVGEGAFAQIAGFEVTYRASRPLGDRIVDLTLDDGRAIVRGGSIVAGAPRTISVASIDFLLRGQDGYPWDGVDFTVLPTTYQEAFLDHLVEDLGGVVRASAYPAGGQGRITPV